MAVIDEDIIGNGGTADFGYSGSESGKSTTDSTEQAKNSVFYDDIIKDLAKPDFGDVLPPD
ncbi:MAG: hypothetical protein R3B93_13955 [Bacteroidia bacterium]